MHRCCPSACGVSPVCTAEACSALSGRGTCSYPVPKAEADSTTQAEAVTTSEAAPATATLVATSTTPPPTDQGSPNEQDTVSALAWEHFELVNALRATGFTCPKGDQFDPNPVPLLFDCRLWKASRSHSEDMAAQNYFSHNSKDGRSPWDRAEAAGIVAHGENIAAGSGSAAGTLDQFKKSDGHCKNMLTSNFKMMAAGYAAGGRYGHYWTQMYTFESDPDTSCYPSGASLAQTSDLAGAPDSEEGGVLIEPMSRPAST